MTEIKKRWLKKYELRKEIESRVKCFVACMCLILAGLIPVGFAAYADSFQTKVPEYIIDYCKEIGDEYAVSPWFLVSVIEHESLGNVYEVSKHGAVGLMQIKPQYQTERMKRLGVNDLFDARSNILVGTDILVELFEKYEDTYTVLMCYNEGEFSGAVERAERGEFSKYAKKVMKRADDLAEYYGDD